jgi:hypothetical protein
LGQQAASQKDLVLTENSEFQINLLSENKENEGEEERGKLLVSGLRNSGENQGLRRKGGKILGQKKTGIYQF